MLRAWFAFDAIVCGLKKQRRAHARGRQIFADTLILSCVGPTVLIRVYSGRVSSCIITTCRTPAGGSVWSVYAAFDASYAVHACMREGSVYRWNVALPRRCLCDDGFRCGFHRKMRVYLTIKVFYRWKGFSATGKPFAYKKNPFVVLLKALLANHVGFFDNTSVTGVQK